MAVHSLEHGHYNVQSEVVHVPERFSWRIETLSGLPSETRIDCHLLVEHRCLGALASTGTIRNAFVALASKMAESGEPCVGISRPL